MLRKLIVPVVAAGTVLLPVAGASAQPAKTKATVVKVTAGSPSEFRFKLSKKTVKKGVVLFKVTNMGTLPHDFRMASKSGKLPANFKIAGKQTPLIQPKKSKTLRVVFKRAGKYAYLCTVSGHAAAGMKGVLTVK